MIRPYYLVL
ncbi:hypothetical protein S40293_11620 [Stachybotrys chartarum IBT 40293]|nr:hypothetical protein S40293_11620 [Stachybotrys chartarum IBT 40293]